MSKWTVCLVALVLAGVSVASADNVCPATNWGDYLALNSGVGGFTSCHVGNLDFSDFSFTPGGTILDPDSSVGVSLITTPGDEGFTFNPGILLAAPPDAANTSQDVELDFQVTALKGAIDDLTLVFNGTVSGTGQTAVSETETGATCPTTCSLLVTNPPNNLGPVEAIFTTPVTTLHVTKDIGATTGAGPGTAQISAVTNQFSQVPEDRLVALLGVILLVGLGFIRRSRRSVTNEVV
jgi:hypothetical protein